VKDHSTPRHPGPFRIASVGGEFAAIIVAIGFVVLGLVGLDIGPGFILGAAVLGIGIAILLRFAHRKPLFPNRFF
jgi:hypothetical protein